MLHFNAKFLIAQKSFQCRTDIFSRLLVTFKMKICIGFNNMFSA